MIRPCSKESWMIACARRGKGGDGCRPTRSRCTLEMSDVDPGDARFHFEAAFSPSFLRQLSMGMVGEVAVTKEAARGGAGEHHHKTMQPARHGLKPVSPRAGGDSHQRHQSCGAVCLDLATRRLVSSKRPIKSVSHLSSSVLLLALLHQ